MPVYVKALGRLPALQIVAHRVVWAAAVLVALFPASSSKRPSPCAKPASASTPRPAPEPSTSAQPIPGMPPRFNDESRVEPKELAGLPNRRRIEVNMSPVE